MPIYLVEGPDGRTHQIEGPVGATPEQIIAAARDLIPTPSGTEQGQLPVDWREDTLGGQFKRGLGRAWEGTKSTVTDLIPALVGSALGYKEYAAEQLSEAAAKQKAAEAQYPTSFGSYKDIRGLGDVPGYIAESLGELAPDIAALMTGTGAAGAVGRRLAVRSAKELVAERAAELAAKRSLTGDAAKALTERYTKLAEPIIEQAGAKGASTGVSLGLPASSYALNAPDVFQSIYEKTGTQDPMIAATMAVPIAMLDTYLPGRILDKLGFAGKARLASNLLQGASETVVPSTFKKAALKELGTVIAGEGLTESAQEALTAAAELMAGAQGSMFSPENIDRYINAGLKGAIGGGVFGAPGAVRSGLQAKAKKSRLDEEAAQQAEKARRPDFELTAPEEVVDTVRPEFELTPSEPTTAPTQMDLGLEPPAPSVQAPPPGQLSLDFETPPRPDFELTPVPVTSPPKEELVTMTRKDLLGLGIPKTAPIIKRIAGLDLTDPENLRTAIRQLSQFAANPKVKPEVASRVKQVVTDLVQPTSPQQGQLQFAPPAPPPPPRTQLGEQLARMKRLRETQAAIEQRTQQEASRRESDLGKLGNIAAAQRQLDIADQETLRGERLTEPVADTTSAGIGVSVPQQPQRVGAPSTPRASASQPSRVVPAQQPAGVPARRAKVLPPAVASQTAPASTTPPATTVPTDATQQALRKEAREFLKGAKYTPEEISNLLKAYLDESGAFTEQSLNELRENLALKDSLSIPLDPGVIEALRRGDFTAAVQALTQSKDARTSKLAKSFLAAALNPKVQIVNDLRDDSGRAVAGLYDPRTNTIRLGAERGMTAHVLIHETGHAALSHVLANPNHPVTRQLQRLLDTIKPYLDTTYGAQDVQEFAAEALGNPEFRGKLHALYPSGEKISAWDQFRNIVGNFFRRLFGLPGKPIDSAMDKVDALINQILSPAPEYRNAGSLYALAAQGRSAVARALDAAADVTEKLPFMTRERVDKIHELLTNTTTDTARAGLLTTLPLNILGEIAQRHIPNAGVINRLVNELSGVIHTRNEQIEALVSKAERWEKSAKGPMLERFKNVVYESTIEEVDPTKSAKDYAAKPGADGKISAAAAAKAKQKQDALRALQVEYNQLDRTGKDLYAQMRDAYAKMYEEIRRSLSKQVEKVLEGQEGGDKIRNEVFRRLLDRAGIDPYFPLTREGDYWLNYSTTDSTGQQDYVVQAFPTERERARFIAENKLQQGQYEIYSRLDQMRYSRAPSSSFISDVIKSLRNGVVDEATGKTTKVPQEKIEAIVKLFLDTLPETAFAKSFQRRQKTSGYARDPMGALRTKLFGTSRQIANMEYAAKLDAELAKMREARELAKTATDTRMVDALINEYQKRVDFIRSPTIPAWSRFVTGIGFNWLLGLNPASALVNLTQVPMVALPYLGGIYGYSEATKAISNAYRVFAGTGRKKATALFGTPGKVETRASMYSLDNLTPDNPLYARYRPLLDIAKEQGQISSSQIYDMLEASDRVGFWQRANAFTGWAFHQAERVNRQVSLIAAYDLELDRLQKEGIVGKNAQERAAEKAINAAELTQGTISVASAPRIAQNAVGRVMFMFKRYGISMLYLQYRMLRDAMRGEDQRVKKAAMAQFAGVVGMSALLAGVQGIPFFGVAALAYNLFKDDDDDDLEMATRKYMGTMLTNGPLSYYTNLDFSGRVSMTDLLVREMRTGDSTSTVASIMEQLGGPVYGVAARIERGLGLMREGYIARGAEQIMPASLGNVFKAARLATEGANTLRGDPITGDVTAWNVAAQALGFSPADYQRQNELNNRMKGIDKRVSQEETKLLRKFYTAGRMGDFEAQMEIRAELQELFTRHPGLGDLGEVLRRSLDSHEKTSREMVHGISVSSKLRAELMQYALDAGM